MRSCTDLLREAPPSSGLRRLRYLLNQHLNYFARGNILDILLRSMDGVQTRMAEAACAEADVVLRPWVCDTRWHDFRNAAKYIDIGRKTALEQLPQLKALVEETTHEHSAPPKHLAIAA
jgi:NTE family protein